MDLNHIYCYILYFFTRLSASHFFTSGVFLFSFVDKKFFYKKQLIDMDLSDLAKKITGRTLQTGLSQQVGHEVAVIRGDDAHSVAFAFPLHQHLTAKT